MSVVQRCPHCGTTKASPGECEACHEAQVRFFCTNHTPGLWLDSSTCPSCGARLGVAPRAPSTSPPADPVRTRSPAPVPAVRERTRASTRAPASAPPPAYSRADPPRASARVRDSRPPRPPARGLDTLDPRLAMWQQLLKAVVRARYMPTRATRYRERPAIGRNLGGCLKRAILGVVLLLIALASAVFMFGRALLG